MNEERLTPTMFVLPVIGALMLFAGILQVFAPKPRFAGAEPPPSAKLGVAPPMVTVWFRDSIDPSSMLSVRDIECKVDDIDLRIRKLPIPRPGLEYYLLAERCEGQPAAAAVSGFDFLGYDLCDETLTSSLLNCGPWTGALEALAARSNTNGLLGWEDALRAKVLLPHEWGEGEPHAWVDLWGPFRRERMAIVRARRRLHGGC